MNIQLTEADQAKVEEFSGRLFMAGLAALELAAIDIGVRLGLYTRLLDGPAKTPAELATSASIHARCAREWVEQQAAAARVGRDAARVAKEVLSHLTGLVGAEVDVSLEITTHVPGGVPEKVVRVVTENARH